MKQQPENKPQRLPFSRMKLSKCSLALLSTCFERDMQTQSQQCFIFSSSSSSTSAFESVFFSHFLSFFSFAFPISLISSQQTKVCISISRSQLYFSSPICFSFSFLFFSFLNSFVLTRYAVNRMWSRTLFAFPFSISSNFFFLCTIFWRFVPLSICIHASYSTNNFSGGKLDKKNRFSSVDRLADNNAWTTKKERRE